MIYLQFMSNFFILFYFIIIIFFGGGGGDNKWKHLNYVSPVFIIIQGHAPSKYCFNLSFDISIYISIKQNHKGLFSVKALTKFYYRNIALAVIVFLIKSCSIISR